MKARAFQRVSFCLATALATVSGIAASVDAADARAATQAWIDGGYSLQVLTAKTVEVVERAAFGTESAYVARLADGGTVILPTDDRIDPVIAFSPSVSGLTTGTDSPLGALLERDLAARMAAATNAPVRMLSVTLEVAQGNVYRIVGVPLYDMGGTFTLSWSGDLTVSVTETVGTEIPVPYSWLAIYYPSADSSTYESLAKSKGANGLTVWESYLAGLDPTNANSKLVVTIRMDGTTPVVEWNVTNAVAQSLGYTYKILGSRVLDADNWSEKSDVSNRFFKVVLEK